MRRHPPRSPLFPYPPLSRSQVARRPAAQQQADRLDEDRFAGAGFAREDVQPRLELDLGETGAGKSNLVEAVGPLLRSEEHTSELQSQSKLLCRLLLAKKKIP